MEFKTVRNLGSRAFWKLLTEKRFSDGTGQRILGNSVQDVESLFWVGGYIS